MVNRRIGASLVAIGTIAAGLISGCVKSGSDSTFFPPTPTPPPPSTIRHCQAVWTMQNADNAALSDAIVLDAPADFWVNGAATVATSNQAGFAYYYLSGEPLSSVHQPDLTHAVGFSIGDTSGSIVLSGITVNGMTVGASVGIDDAAHHDIYMLDTANNPVLAGFVASNGSFSGNVTDMSSTLDLGSGNTNLVLGTASAGTFGSSGLGAYVGCYDQPAG